MVYIQERNNTMKEYDTLRTLHLFQERVICNSNAKEQKAKGEGASIYKDRELLNRSSWLKHKPNVM